jgi:tRNA threonylcarbamoyl adenosine modification protein (Sua5/YciO/YrdC/YwlC family)
MRTLRADQLDEAADALFAAKDRPGSLPIAVLCADAASARAVAASWPSTAARLAERFWPGPLTVVVPADAAVTARVHAARGIGLRVPDDATSQALLSVTGPLAVTSANRHGAEPAVTATALRDAFDGGPVVAVVDDGPRDGVVSTVVDLTAGEPEIVREGALPGADVLAALA